MMGAREYWIKFQVICEYWTGIVELVPRHLYGSTTFSFFIPMLHSPDINGSMYHQNEQA